MSPIFAPQKNLHVCLRNTHEIGISSQIRMLDLHLLKEMQIKKKKTLDIISNMMCTHFACSHCLQVKNNSINHHLAWN